MRALRTVVPIAAMGAALFALSREYAFSALMTAALLAVLVAVLVLAVRIFSVWREMVVVALALGIIFTIGFAVPLMEGPSRHILRAVLAMLGLGLVAFTVVSVGRLAKTGSTAGVVAGIFIPLSLFAALSGDYAARATGWHGLYVPGPGSDHPGFSSVEWGTVASAPFWLILATAAGWLAAWVNSREGEAPHRMDLGRP